MEVLFALLLIYVAVIVLLGKVVADGLTWALNKICKPKENEGGGNPQETEPL